MKPAPFTLEICWAAESFNVAAVPTVTGVVFSTAAPPASVSVPAFTEVAPVNVFAPASVNSEEPPLAIPKIPLTTPDNVTGLSVSTLIALPNAAAPPKLSAPLFAESPIVKVPDNANALSTERAAVESLETRPDPMRKTPVPRALELPICRVPALKFNPPVKLLAPESVSTEFPFFTRPPAPVITLEIAEATVPLSVREPAAIFTNPRPFTDATSSEAFSLSVPAAPRSTELAFAIALPPATASTPPLMVVSPVNVFVPLKINSAAPSFTNP
jgi:hypothetical protein